MPGKKSPKEKGNERDDEEEEEDQTEEEVPSPGYHVVANTFSMYIS